MNIKNKKAVVIAIITVLDMIVNIYNSINIAEDGLGLAIVSGVLLALCDILLLFSIIEMANKPVRSMILLTLAQTFTFIFDLVDGATVSGAFADIGVVGIIVVIALAYHTANAYKKSNENASKNITTKEKILNTVNYERAIYSINGYTRIVIYSLIISVILSTAGSEMMELFNDNVSFRLYSAVVLVIPALLVVSIITTSTLAYDLFIIKILFEVYTLYLLGSIGQFEIIQILYIVVEVIAIIYAYFVTFSNRHKD